MQTFLIRCAVSILLLAMVPGAARSQPFILDVPIRAVAQDTSKPVAITWIATESGIFRSSETTFDWRNVYLRPAGELQPPVRFVHIDAADPHVVYLVSNLDAGGVWKTVDNGATWTQANKGLPTSGSIDAFLDLPSAPLTFYAKVDGRVFRTTDGAATWTFRGDLPLKASVLEVNRSTPELMYAGLNNAVYRSRDEGATWALTQVMNAGAITSILVDPSDPAIVHMTIAGLRKDRPGFYRSHDGGLTFAVAGAFDVDHLLVARLVSDPTGRAVYAGFDEDGFIFRTVDKGITWAAIAVSPGAGFSAVAIDPSDPRIVLAGTARGLFGSDNGGTSWRDRRGPARPTLSLPVAPLEFNLPADSQGKLQMLVRPVETSQWTVPVSMSAVGAAWLKLEGVAVNTPATPKVAVDTQGLELGSYTGEVRVEAPSSANAPVTIPVKLNVVLPRPVSQAYQISTFAGTGQRGNFGDNQPAIRAFFSDLDSLAVDRDGNIFVSDPASNVVRRIGTDGIITRYAGSGRRGDVGDGGSALLAQLDSPSGLAVDAAGTLYIADTGNAKIRRVAPDGTITTLAAAVGPCRGLALDSSGNVYVTVPALHIVGRVTPSGQVSVFAGTVSTGGFRGDGGAPGSALLSGPLDVFVDSRDRIYIADTGNNRIRRVAAGVITTVAGSGIYGYQGEGPDATKVALAAPGSVAADSAGNIYIGDTESNRIRMVRPNGGIRTLAGTGTRGFSGDNGLAVLAQITGPQDVAVNKAGEVFSAEPANVRIRRLVPPPPPLLPEVTEGPLNWADGSAHIAPGTVFRLSGTNLAEAEASQVDAPWPATLGGVQVILNGQAVPLSRVSASEIVGLIPFSAALGTGTLQVSRDDVLGKEIGVTLDRTAPALVLSEPGRALASNEDGSTNSARQPAAAGSLLMVFLTGMGLTENPPVDGAGSGEAAKPLLPVLVQFGDVTIEPVSARLTPGRVGIAEVQFRVPSSDPGDYPVAVRVGDNLSAGALISVGPGQ